MRRMIFAPAALCALILFCTGFCAVAVAAQPDAHGPAQARHSAPEKVAAAQAHPLAPALVAASVLPDDGTKTIATPETSEEPEAARESDDATEAGANAANVGSNSTNTPAVESDAAATQDANDTIFPLEEGYEGLDPVQELLKSSKPVRVKASPKEVTPLEHFLRVAFQDRAEQYALLKSGTGFEAPPGRLMRWGKLRITYAVEGDADPEELAIIHDAADEVSRILDGRDISFEEREHVPDIHIRIEDIEADTLRTGLTRVLADRTTGVLQRATVELYRVKLTPASVRRHLLLALGLRGWALPGVTSVLWFPVDGVTPPEVTAYPEIDKEALLLLYHPALMPGMTLEQTLAALDKSAPEVDVPDVPGVTAPAYEPRLWPELRAKELLRQGEPR